MGWAGLGLAGWLSGCLSFLFACLCVCLSVRLIGWPVGLLAYLLDSLTVDAMDEWADVRTVLVDMRSQGPSCALSSAAHHGAMAVSESGLSVGRSARRKRRMEPAADKSPSKAARAAPAGGTEPRFGPKANLEATAAIKHILTQGASDEGILQLRQALVYSVHRFGAGEVDGGGGGVGAGAE